MNHPEHPPAHTAVEVHHPQPLAVQPTAAPLVPAPSGVTRAVQSVVLPDGRVVTGYTLAPTATPEPAPVVRPAVSRTAVNIALGGIGFAAFCGGLALAAAFIAALAALVQQLIILAAVIFGGWIAAAVFGPSRGAAGTTVNIRKAVIKRSRFYG
ncbi:hypothetical protein ABZ819_23255 [Streptomyces venezuelae]|uniref:hypothetical protein n=1 Tax=Streptomyces venezuelae TaxID=54571 RepID=UPI003439BF06